MSANMKTVLLLADVPNLYRKVLKKFPGRKIDYKKYLESAKGEDILYRAIAYTYKKNPDSYKFVSCLGNYGFEIRCKETNSAWYESWDVAIAVDCLQIVKANKVDKVILGSSHSVFIPLINALKQSGIECVVYSAYIPSDMRDAASSVREITEKVLMEIANNGDEAQ